MTTTGNYYLDHMITTAAVLTGRPCIVRLREPATRGSHGALYMDPNGTPVIDIDPSLGQWTIPTLLHELAHVKLHAGLMERSNTHTQAPRTQPSRHSQAKRPTWESAADQLRDQWLEVGRRLADPSEQDQDIAIMKALIKTYYKKEG